MKPEANLSRRNHPMFEFKNHELAPDLRYEGVDYELR